MKSVFGTDKDTVERLQSRLEKKFGKIEERRPNLGLIEIFGILCAMRKPEALS